MLSLALPPAAVEEVEDVWARAWLTTNVLDGQVVAVPPLPRFLPPPGMMTWGRLVPAYGLPANLGAGY